MTPRDASGVVWVQNQETLAVRSVSADEREALGPAWTQISAAQAALEHTIDWRS